MELADLSSALQDNLEDEIALLRILMRRVFEYADAAADSLEEWEHALSTLGSAASRLAGLLRTQQAITGKSRDVVGLLSEAIGEVAHELGVNKS